VGEPDPRIVAADFYHQHYHAIRPSLRPGTNKTKLGDEGNRICRFCRKREPEVSFRSDAHAIPESLGNKILFTNYECDSCNQFFGRGIENDFGIWSHIDRTLGGISGKHGVPTAKGAGWRIENESDHIQVKRDGTAPDYVLDEEKKRFQFDIERGTYTPVAVLKAFVRIGLTLMPGEELPNFSEALDWIQEEDHTKSSVEQCPVFETSLSGIKLDRVHAFLLIRKVGVRGVPYAFLNLAYGYKMFQVCLPSLQDRAINGRDLTFPPYPILNEIDPALYREISVKPLDFCGREQVKGEQVPVVFGFAQIEIRD